MTLSKRKQPAKNSAEVTSEEQQTPKEDNEGRNKRWCNFNCGVWSSILITVGEVASNLNGLFRLRFKDLSETKSTKVFSKVLLVKSSKNGFIFLPVFYLIMWFMKAQKNFEK